jgi:hypothetical protein
LNPYLDPSSHVTLLLPLFNTATSPFFNTSSERFSKKKTIRTPSSLLKPRTQQVFLSSFLFQVHFIIDVCFLVLISRTQSHRPISFFLSSLLLFPFLFFFFFFSPSSPIFLLRSCHVLPEPERQDVMSLLGKFGV